jgi:hypothetical protein
MPRVVRHAVGQVDEWTRGCSDERGSSLNTAARLAGLNPAADAPCVANLRVVVVPDKQRIERIAIWSEPADHELSPPATLTYYTLSV